MSARAVGPDDAAEPAPDGSRRSADRSTPAQQPLVEPTATYRIGRFLTGTYLRLVHRFGHEGREHVPAQGGALIVANHASFLDIPAIANAAPRHVGFVARESLARSRFLAFVMRESGAILLRRGAADRRALRAMTDHLRLGDLVAVFPEGTRSPDGRLQEFRPGALFAARQAGVPIVPAAIRGSHAALPRGARLPRLARVTVAFGPPQDAAAPDALERVREAIEGLLSPS